MKSITLAVALALVSSLAFAHGNTQSVSTAGGIVGSVSGAASGVGAMVDGNGKASFSTDNFTTGQATVQTITGNGEVGVQTTAGTTSQQVSKGKQSGNAFGGTAGFAGSQAGAAGGGFTMSSFGNFGW